MSNELSEKRRPSKRLVSFLMVLFILTLGIGIGTLISFRVDAVGPGDSQLKIRSGAKPIGGDAAFTLSRAFQEVAQYVGSAVVNIGVVFHVIIPVFTARQNQKHAAIPKYRHNANGLYCDKRAASPDFPHEQPPEQCSPVGQVLIQTLPDVHHRRVIR